MIHGIDRILFESNAIEGEYGWEALKDAVAAWDWLCGATELNMGNILGAHRELMRTLNPTIAGTFRMVDVRVGDYYPPHWSQVPERLAQWLKQYANADTPDKIEEAHIAFENIHPFEDGNGRIGRIIMNWQRKRAGYALEVIWEAYKPQYYNLFSLSK